MTAALELRGITKAFGGTVALDGLDLLVEQGRLHILLGENGAGKSTALHLIYGLQRPDQGSMALQGERYRPADPREAKRRGVGMVHQHFTSVAGLSVWENIVLAAGWSHRGARARAVEQLQKNGLKVDPDRPAGAISVGDRSRLELAKEVASQPSLLLLDEPTGTLDPADSGRLFATLRQFVADGGTAVLITHKLDEALAHGDAITVLRQGRVTASWGQGPERGGPTRDALLQAMLGSRDGPGPRLLAPRTPGEIVARLRGIDLRAGEVVGIAGIQGNGQRELLRDLAFGTDARGIAFIPEDRTIEGAIPEFTLIENVALQDVGVTRTKWLDWNGLRDRTVSIIERSRVVAAGPDAPMASLSGGNQQKIVVGRALAGSPRIIVAENPGRGLDIAAAEEVFFQLRAAAASGVAVLFHSTDLDEVIDHADRVVVMAGGDIHVPRPGAGRDEIGHLMVSLPRSA
jgi:ABC-type uncharacterized transport system ATPase subunit